MVAATIDNAVVGNVVGGADLDNPGSSFTDQMLSAYVSADIWLNSAEPAGKSLVDVRQSCLVLY